MRKNINTKILNKGVTLSVAICSILIFSTITVSAIGQVIVDANRDMILDDPSGWVSGWSGNTGVGNQWNGESTTVRWYVLVLDPNGHAVPGVTVTTNLIRPNGIVNYSSSAFTDSNGYANFSRNLDNFNQNASSVTVFEGNWTINATATVESQLVRGTDRVIYDEYGCGKSGSNCHASNYWQSSGVSPKKPANTWGWATSTAVNSPYVKDYDWDIIHGSGSGSNSGHGSKGNINSGECVTCHKSYDGIYRGLSIRQTITPQYSGGIHANKIGANCTNCHGTMNSSSAVTNMPIKKCYDCHPIKNNNVSVQNYVQSSTHSYSYWPLNSTNGDIRAHNSGNTTACITCHDGGHNVTKPNSTAAMSNTYTENEQCWACHTNRTTTHYSNSNCVSCHTQNAHKVSLGGGPDCISCHNNAGSATHKVDTNAMVLGEHANLNSGATVSGVPIENKKCWGCHQTGGTQPTGMGDRYQNPYKCYDCHNAAKPYANVNSAPTVSEHFKNGTDIQAAVSATDNSTSCLTCHNVTEMKVSYTESDGLNNGSSLASHYGKNRSDLRVAGGSITDCRYCHQNTSTAFSGAMANIVNNNMVNHSVNPLTPACTECHGVGKIHDSPLNKPVSNDSLCKNCHTAKNEHKTLYCTECHANNTPGNLAGRDIHGIKFLQKDNTFLQSRTNAVDCTTCHQLSVVDSSIGATPLKISDPLHHSDDIINGSKWDNYWTSPIGACIYCHNDTRHDATPLGRPLIWNTSYIMGTTIGTGTNCADCHQKGDSNYNAMKLTFEAKALPIPPEITNGSWKGKPGYYNHTLSSYTDSQCKSCHDKGGSTTVDQLTHNVSVGTSGGPDCKSCHDIGGIAPVHVNFSVSGGTDSLHTNLNNGAQSTVDTSNKKCWACHGDGTQPANGQHSSNYRTPYTCENCHAQQQGGYNSPVVNNHYWNGTNITTGSVSSCKQCHNKTEMMLSVSSVEIVDNSNHYGKKRSDLATQAGTNSYCAYCHNTTTENTVFGVSDYNNSITNHSVSGATPLCTTCHSTGRLHDSGLAKPTSSDTLCKSCHTAKSEHKTLYCTECHANASSGIIAGKDIHGIKFLQKDNTFSQDRTNSVDCTTCHQKSDVDSSLGTFSPPKINDPLHHSDNTSNGSVWGTYWTSTNPIEACLYCHNDTKHSATPLGRPLEWNSSYEINTAIGSGTNCADCHYQGDGNYGGMSSTFTGAGRNTPPEITSGSWNGKPGYFNHTLSDYTDAKCRTCHGNAGMSTVGALVHNVSKGGAGGDDCIGCHNSISPAAPQVVDINVFNTSIHQNINNPVNKDYRVTNEDCWQCHYNKDMVRTNIKKCRDCHAKPSQWHGNANVTTNLTALAQK